MVTPTYQIVLDAGRVLASDVSADEVASICADLGYDRAYVLRKLRDNGRAVLKDDVGRFEIIRHR